MKTDPSLHVTGKSEFVDDITPISNEVQIGVITSSITKGEITRLDYANALKCDGIIAVFTAADFVQPNWGAIFHDQPLLAAKEINYQGEAIALIVGNSKEAIRVARKHIKIEYKKSDAILDIETSRRLKQFVGPTRVISRSIENRTIAESLIASTHRLQGTLKIAGQDHFYLESQAAIAYPTEFSGISVISSTQHPTEVQHVVAHALGLKLSEVNCAVTRLGGGFGGKESQATPFAAYAALVAHKLNRPARLVLTKDEDMVLTGKRNPFLIEYEVGFNSDGLITALKADLFSDSGAYADLSTAIMERAMLHCDNAYYLPNARITGTVCKTHTAPSTAFRGFGGPKGVALIETIIENIALVLKKDSLDIRKLNAYQKSEQTTPYGQTIENNCLPELFSKLETSSQYRSDRAAVTAFNAKASKQLASGCLFPTPFIRGLSLTPIKFGISFSTRYLNQAAALVNLHLDGTVQVATGAVEMGQGVNTKIALAVAEIFGISIDKVRVTQTSTEKIHNTSATAASSGADLNATAARNAALEIRDRLSAFATKFFERKQTQTGKAPAAAGIYPELNCDESTTEGTTGLVSFEKGKVISVKSGDQLEFDALILEAYLNRINLGARGFFRYPGIHYNKETGEGQPFFYFTQGVASSLVEINCLTGDFKLLKAEILIDLGRPFHLPIDRGQVTGAFIQGLGWLTTEKLHYTADGRLLSISPSTYKIPGIGDIPERFEVSFLNNVGNSKNIRGSKAVGEPPLLLAISAWTAAQNAIQSLDTAKPCILPIPATAEVLQLEIQKRLKGLAV